MEKAATLSLRVNPQVKRDAEGVLDQLGIPMSTAITMYLKQIVITGGIPFSPKLPAAPRSIDADRMTDAELVRLINERTLRASNDDAVSLDEAEATGRC